MTGAVATAISSTSHRAPGGERVDEELVDRDDALAFWSLRHNRRAEREHRRGVVVRRVGVREVATDRSQVANERIGDDRGRVGDDRVALPDDRVRLEVGLTDESADAQLAVLSDLREAGHAVDVDENGRLGET